MRSKWKTSLSSSDLKLINNKIFNPSKVIANKNLLNNRVQIYSGKSLVSIIVRDYMLNDKFSNFVSSKYTGKIIHIKKKKRKK